jgi:hypothetical protein
VWAAQPASETDSFNPVALQQQIATVAEFLRDPIRGGDVTVTSEPGKGSVFTVCLPAARTLEFVSPARPWVLSPAHHARVEDRIGHALRHRARFLRTVAPVLWII